MIPPVEPWWAKHATALIIGALTSLNVWLARLHSHVEHKETGSDVKEIKETLAKNGNGKDHPAE